MNAVDTNVVVRFLTRSDAAQFGITEGSFAAQESWISTTVLLETE